MRSFIEKQIASGINPNVPAGTCVYCTQKSRQNQAVFEKTSVFSVRLMKFVERSKKICYFCAAT